MLNGTQCCICKKAPCALHGIGRGKLAYICEQVATGQHTAKPDQRRRHLNRPHKLSDKWIDFVKQHISSFPAEMSHYSRSKNMHRRYLSSVLSIRIMYDEYILFRQQQQIKPVSSYSYRYIFTSHFNLGFGSPRSDACSLYDNLDKCVNADMHKQRADVAFEVQKHDKKLSAESKLLCITFDLQQTLPLPKLSTSKAFYLCQVWSYNLGVQLTFGSTSSAFFHSRSENEGGRGCAEIGSSVFAFLKNSNCSGKCKHLVAWSDSCWPK